MKTKKIFSSIAFYTGLLLLWELLYLAGTEWLHLVKSYAVPNPVGVWNSFLRLLSGGALLAAAGHSLLRAAAGFVIAVILGILFGVLILNSEFLCRCLKPLMLGVQTLPSICWVPFAILWFGLGESSIIFVVVMGSAFGIALSVESGIRSVPPVYIKAAKTMGVKGAALYRKVIFPAALPAFVSGLKQGWSFAWRALMSGEVMSASVGLGYTLILGRDLADINQVMTVMLVIIAFGILIDRGIFSRAEHHILKI
ncbi:MAG: ABC transporter permease [Blautia sp.]|nr:ABC transporter permease [Blautia sp.]